MSAGLILVVCTGNVCRSPYIERVLGAALAQYDVGVSSAGTHALVGEPMAEGSARLLRAVGRSADGFVARQLTAELVRSADLILTATRGHRSDVVRMAPSALRHTHAIADFADLASSAEFDSDSERSASESFVAQLAAGAAARRGSVPVRSAADAEIGDPFRRSAEAFEEMAAQLDGVLPPIIDAARRLDAVRW